MCARYRRASDLALAERLLRGRRATLGDRHPKTGRAWLLLGYAQHVNGQKVAAQQTMEAGQKLIEAAYGRHHPEYALSLQMTSSLAARASRNNLASLREAFRISQDALGPNHETTLFLRYALALRLHDLPPSLLKLDDHKEAEALFTQNMRIKLQAGIPAPWEKLMEAHSLLLHGGVEDLPRAEALLRDSRLDAQRYFAPGDNYPAMLKLFSIQLRYQQGYRVEADRDFAGIIDTYRDNPAHLAQLYLHDSWMYRSLYAYERCDNAQAQTYLKQALASERDRLGSDHFIARDTASLLDNLRRHGRLISSTGAQVPAKMAMDAAQVRASACRAAHRGEQTAADPSISR
jgi:serine/threonine-protein kinase